MLEEVKFNFYRIERCGYYKRGESAPAFCDIGQTLSELSAWAFDGKPFAETCTYEPDDDSGELNTYCFKMNTAGNGDVLLTTWNETETLEGALASVKGSDPAGKATVDSSPVPAGNIAGYPTYFWFIPSKNIFATLRIGTRANGHANLRMFMRDFLSKFTSYCVTETDSDGEEKIVGYRASKNSKTQQLSPVFVSRPAKLPGRIEYLKKHRAEITKITRKSVLSAQNQNDRSYWQRISENLGLTSSPSLAGDVRVKAELSFNPNEAELDQIIKEWESEIGSTWSNVGFDLKGHDDTVWLSHALVKDKLNLDITKDIHGIISLPSLQIELEKHRLDLLNMLS